MNTHHITTMQQSTFLLLPASAAPSYKWPVGFFFCESASEHFGTRSLKIMPPHLTCFLSFIWQRRRSVTSVVKCLCLPGGQRYISVRGRNRNRAPPLRNGGACLKVIVFIFLPNGAQTLFNVNFIFFFPERSIKAVLFFADQHVSAGAT